MSTRITDSVSPATDHTDIRAYREGVGGPQVHLKVVDAGQRPEHPALAQFDRAEFIRAIETELDVTVINGPLPSVRVDQSGPTHSLIADTFSGRSIARYVTEDPTRRRATALAEEAIARYLEVNPPVDEAAVDALAKVLIEHGEAPIPGTLKPEALARRLVKAGVRAPEETNKDGAA